jgi:D-alanyl-D-alanine carboxypeptidase
MTDSVFEKRPFGERKRARWFAAIVVFLVFQITVGAVSALSPYTPPPPPPSSADAVYVYDATSGVPLFARDADARLAPGSLTKIVTALVVLEHADLDDVVTIQATDIVDESQSRVQLVAGDSLTVRDLLWDCSCPRATTPPSPLPATSGPICPQREPGPLERTSSPK